MIRKTDKGFKVVSHSGKNLSSNNLTKAQAKRRLKQVEFFKRLKGKTNDTNKLGKRSG